MKPNRAPYIVWFALILHATWAVMLIVDPVSQNATPLHALVAVFGILTAPVLILTVGLTLSGLYNTRDRITTMLQLVPQQILLYIAAIGAAVAISHGTYADLVQRPRMFIAADQSPIILSAIFYTLAMVQIARNRWP